ncbi:MAG: hypothetical protein ACR2NS_00595 [Gemmatimonadaceae bacterium]
MTLFVVFLFLAIYNTGCMTALQLQHYGIYPLVGREGFARYMSANNGAAAVPTIIPGMVLLLVSIGLVVFRPAFVQPLEAWAALALNLVTLFSTFRWQRPLQGEMAASGYDETKIRTVIRTNWIRTLCYWLLSALAISILVRLLNAGVVAPT